MEPAMFTARLEFDDDTAFDLEVEDGETLAEAAMRQDAPLRVDCLSGECGACLGRCADRIRQGPPHCAGARHSASCSADP